MPTSSGTVELWCDCGARWTVKRRRGQYPSQCPECVAREERMRLRREAQRQDREDERARKATAAAVIRRATPGRARSLAKKWAPLLTDPEIALHADVLTRVARQTPTAGLDAQALRSAVVRLAHARGALGKRDALEALAAVCVAQASAVGDGSNRDEHRS